MRRILWWLVLLGAIGGFVMLARLDFQAASSSLRIPWEWFLHREINARLLDVSQAGAQPMEAAGRRLLKPFGRLRLVRVIHVDPDTLSPGVKTEQKNDLRIPEKDPTP